MQKLIIAGNVGRDAEIKANNVTQELFATFSVAVNSGTKDNQKTDWFEVVCSEKHVDLARNFIKKGTSVIVEGKPRATGWQDKDGVIRTKLVCNATFIELTGRPSEEQQIVSDEETEAPAL